MHEQAAANWVALNENPYPGRGIVAGVDDTGKHLVQVCWIMGRSPNSRNRVYRSVGERVFTDLARPDPQADTKLIIYNAMGRYGNYFIASNGDQTDTLVEEFEGTKDFHLTLLRRKYEPDAPNYTPRITALCAVGRSPAIQLSILRKSPWDMLCHRHLYTYDTMPPGYGMGLTTYMGDGDPLPAFDRMPYLLPIDGGVGDAADLLWSMLNKDNRVALACKFISMDTGNSVICIINNNH